MIRTSVRVFCGANIKGTPAMPASSVLHDLRIIKAIAHIMGLQEFKWPWYWRVANTLLGVQWRSFPTFAKGLGHPIDGAQALIWRWALLRRTASKALPAFNFGEDTAGIEDNRYVRAVNLRDVLTSLRCWYLSTHFTVGGDTAHDGEVRQRLLRENIAALDRMLTMLIATGDAIMGELDANIRPGTWAYGALMAVLHKHGATLHGELGVEYAFTIDGATTRVIVDSATTIPTSKLKTDHEVRVLHHHLVG